MAEKTLLDPALLRQLLRYEPDTGRLFWHRRPVDMFPDARAWKIWNTRYAGKEAFTAHSSGYRNGRIFDKGHRAHRVIWAIVHGESPAMEIDHIDGDRTNNRIDNLRHINGAENQRNKGINKNNTSGVLGVCRDTSRNKWLARIWANGREVTLGRFDELEEAVSARKVAIEKYGYHPNHGRD